MACTGVDTGTHFTGFTGTKVQILTQLRHLDGVHRRDTGAHFTCFTGTKVQILTQMREGIQLPCLGHTCACFTSTKVACFTGTNGQIQLREAGVLGTFVGNALGSVYLLCWYKRTNSDAAEGTQLALLALLVQKDKF
jgi:hypothetical protein